MDEKQVAMHKIVAAIHQAGLQGCCVCGLRAMEVAGQDLSLVHTAGVANFFGHPACDAARAAADIQALPARCNTESRNAGLGRWLHVVVDFAKAFQFCRRGCIGEHVIFCNVVQNRNSELGRYARPWLPRLRQG